ncbi:FecR family protein [Flavobacterium sp. IMCC34852]|uniref:FecR family protein n=1 Tax=Flavobacterium rivulicola TaxID=2732161 RepID=A0A7Y3R919_9FLAO|nr:FecR family protein [Flavobacterium sp. IMCC34852]NNT72117.1 FecR family protein [Flavobacterium sp. IMCC34852]
MEENYKLAKWLSGEMPENELAAFQAEPDFALYDKIKKYSAELETPTFNEQLVLSKILVSPKKEIKTISLMQNWFFRIAAVLVIGLGLFFTFQNFASYTEYAENGVLNTFTLPDNSEVVLNSGSEIQYKKWNWDNNRALNLEGEAYFKVAKGQKFEVNTPLGKVTVLGTQFNVKQRDNRFDVTCYEGKVKVNYKDQELVITKGMSIAFDNGKSITIPESTVQSPEWLNDELVFYQEDLKSIVSELERHFNVSLVIKNIDNSQLFTGTIPAKNIALSLEILATTYHLKSTQVSKNEYRLESLDAQ